MARRRFVILLGPSLLAICMAEGTARLVLSIAPVLYAFDESNAVNRLRWIRRHDAGIEIYYGFDRYDSRLGWTTRPGLNGIEAFDGKRLSTNARGLRGQRDIPYERSERPRVVLLGDSFTFGDDASDDEIWPARLEETLPDIEIVNLAVHGYGLDQILLLFEDQGVRYRPDIVVLGFVADDMRRTRFWFRDYAKPMFELRGSELHLASVPVPPPAATLAAERRTLRLVDLALMTWEAWRWRGERGPRHDYLVAERILARLAGEARSIGALFWIVYLPILPEEMNSDAAEPLAAERMLAELASRSGALSWSARDQFRAQVAEGHFFRLAAGGHWLPDGHAAVADSIARRLVAERLLLPAAPEDAER